MSQPTDPAGSLAADPDNTRRPPSTDHLAPAGRGRNALGRRGFGVLLGTGALIVALIGAIVGLAIGGGPRTVAAVAPGSVDVGFARDMVVHHSQGVVMAHIAEGSSADREIRLMAYNIVYTQTSQVGEMLGWLDLWRTPRISSDAPMAWMPGSEMTGMSMAASASGSTADPGADVPVMPGMATDAEMDRLQKLTGKAGDIYFLQLMVRHHQGGAPMMSYAADHAASPVVKNFAGKMLESQTSEVSVMTQMLQARGAAPLAATAPPTG